MSKPPGILLFLLASIVFATGCVGGGCVGASRTRDEPGRAIYAPLPHHVAPAPDAAAFRFAMVHDVIHERYPRHGPAYYAERERLAREKMADLHPDSETALALTDDIAVGLDRRGRTDEAIALMRDKLKRQNAIGLTGKDLYSSYANLGEFLVHGNLWAMCAGDAAARARVQEGIEFTRKSLAVNPKAHFGREEWQLVALGFFIDASTRPELIRKIDLIGNRLDRELGIPAGGRTSSYYEDDQAVFGRPYLREWTWTIHSKADRNQYLLDVADSKRHTEIRKHIARVGGESAEPEAKEADRGRRAPFDEPAMWLIGEWRQGSGPSAHSALCLGEIMLRVGQRYLAWSCYERASRLADKFWPMPDAQKFLQDHCWRRQAAIENSQSKAEVANLRPQFESELAFGERYQRDYQAFTEVKIQSGANLNDLHFFDEFHSARAPIASKVGPEEWYAGSSRHELDPAKLRAYWQWGVLSGGACLLLAAIIANWIYRPRPTLEVTDITPPPSPAPELPPASSDPTH